MRSLKMKPFSFTTVRKAAPQLRPPSFTESVSTKEENALRKLLIQTAASLIAACRTYPKGEKPLPGSNVWQVLAQGFEPKDYEYIHPQELLAAQAWFIYNFLEGVVERKTMVVFRGELKIYSEALRAYKCLIDWLNQKGFPREDQKQKFPLCSKEFNNSAVNEMVFSGSKKTKEA